MPELIELDDEGATSLTASPAAIEAWLGLSPGEALIVRHDAARANDLRLTCLLPLFILGPLLAALDLSPIPAALREAGWLLLSLWGGYVALWVEPHLRDVRLEADGGHLYVRDEHGRHACAWDELTGLARIPTGWRVTTRDDVFQLDAELPGSERVAYAVRQLLGEQP